MRTTPLQKWKDQAESFDKGIWDAAQNILGLAMSAQSWKQACLTPRLGGIGLRRIVDHADIAFTASWWESRSTSRENWPTREDVKSCVGSQKQGSFEKDEEILKTLIEQAPDQRDRQRLNRFKCEHAECCSVHFRRQRYRAPPTQFSSGCCHAFGVTGFG